MAFPVAAGSRDLSGSSVKYIPVVYSGKYLVKFFYETVFGAIANRDHEKEISAFGDTVEIRGLPDITISTYYKDMGLTYEKPTPANTTLYINKGKSWSFSTNKVDDKQVDLKDYVDQWMGVATTQLKEAVDAQILGDVYSDAHASNKGATAGVISANLNLGVDGGTSVALTKNDVLDKIVECRQVLVEQNVPVNSVEPWMVIPAWMSTLISTSDLKDASLTGDSQSPIRNGRLGKVAGFTLYESNQLSTGADGSANTCTRILFGTNHAISFAAQITENEHIVNPNDFGILHRGLMVYGYKVVKPQALGVLFARKGS